MSFYGDSDEVYMLLRTASHKTRAFITNAKGLKGFLVRGIISIIKEAISSGEIKEVIKYQNINPKKIL